MATIFIQLKMYNTKAPFIYLILGMLIITVTFSCGVQKEPTSENADTESFINAEDIARHIEELASDAYMGRMPCTEGEEKTVAYIESEMKKLGVEPGNNGSYFQEVPMIEVKSTLSEKMQITKGNGGKIELHYFDDFSASSPWLIENIKLENSEVIFAGFGITAPEYDWNDFEGVDITGKTILVLVNDPGYWSKEKDHFKGETMTYYGRWTYKFEEAARRGADAVFVIHETEPAGYSYSVVQDGNGSASLFLESEDGNKSKCKIRGWISFDVAKKLFEESGTNYETAFESAKKPGFKAFSLDMYVSIEANNTFKSSTSKNVIGKIAGTGQSDECIVYMGHWDHLGIKLPPVDGDSICNGAVDNASGIGCILEIAQAFTKLRTKPMRSILFLAVTAEEQGLLGSAYYTQNPVFPLEKTVAAINMDAMNILGEMKDVTVVGFGQCELDEYAEAAAKEQGRYILPNPRPQHGSYFRSDLFNFAKVGVPAMNVKGRNDHVKHGKEWAHEQAKKWGRTHYHSPSDEFDAATWDLSGMVQDAVLMYKIGRKLSNESTFPKWKEGSEFKAIREEGR